MTLNRSVPHTDIAPTRSYSLNSVFVVGGVAINSQGKIVGFISEDNALLPASYITRLLSKVLNRQALAYPSLGVEGRQVYY